MVPLDPELRERLLRAISGDNGGDIDDDIPPPVPLDAELLELAKGAPPNIVQQIYAEQARRNQSRPDLMGFHADNTQDSKPKRTGRRVHLHLRRD